MSEHRITVNVIGRPGSGKTIIASLLRDTLRAVYTQATEDVPEQHRKPLDLTFTDDPADLLIPGFALYKLAKAWVVGGLSGIDINVISVRAGRDDLTEESILAEAREAYGHYKEALATIEFIEHRLRQRRKP